MRKKFTLWTAILTVGAAACVLLLPLPNDYRSLWLSKLFDLGHVPLFALVTICFWRVVGRVWLAFGLAAAATIVVEIGQGFVGRSQEPLDVLRGVLGAALGLIALVVLRRPLRWRAIAVGLASAIALIAWPVWDSGPVLIDAIRACRTFPVLSDFSSSWEVRRWSTHGATLEREAVQPGERWIGQLQVSPEGGDAILFPIVRDWSGYHRLSWTFSFSGDPLNILFSVRDGLPVKRPRQRFDLKRQYVAGRHCVVIDLEELAVGTHSAPLNLSRIQSVHIVVIQPNRPRTLILHRIELE